MERREFFEVAASAGVAVGALAMANNANAQGLKAVKSQALNRLFNLDKQSVTWKRVSGELVAEYPWLKLFAQSIDEKITADISQFDVTPLRFEPILVEQLLADISQLLDTVLSARREALDLEVMAVKRALDYALFQELTPLDRKMAANTYTASIARHNIDAQGSKASAAKFGEVEGLGAAFQIQASTSSNIAATQAAAAKTGKDDTDTRFAMLEKYQQLLESRHTQQGNGLNYADRFARVVKVLLEDFRESYEKAFAVRYGLESIFGIKVPFPPRDSMTLIDDLVSWTRAVIREHERVTANDIEYDLIIPFKQKWGVLPGLKAQFDTILAATGELSLELPAGVFPQQERPRVVAVGISFFTDSPATWNSAHGRQRLFRASVVAPAQRNASSNNAYLRPPIQLGNVGPFDPVGSPTMIAGPAVHNIAPVGTWRVKLDMDALTLEAVDPPPTRTVIKELFLHLRLAAKTSSV